MLVASVLLWANVRDRGQSNLIESQAFGWPFIGARHTVYYRFSSYIDVAHPAGSKWIWNFKGIAINVGVALAVLGVAAVGCEWVCECINAQLSEIAQLALA